MTATIAALALPTGSVGESVTVASVLSGDRLRLSDGRTVRLAQVDAPDGWRCHAWRARRELTLLLPAGAVVSLSVEPRIAASDRRGQLVRYVTHRREVVNLTLLRRGAAAPYFAGGRGRHAARMLRLSREARRHRVGAWGNCNALMRPDRPWLTQRRQPDRKRPNWSR